MLAFFFAVSFSKFFVRKKPFTSLLLLGIVWKNEKMEKKVMDDYSIAIIILISIFAIAFVVLVVYLVQTLQKAAKILRRVDLLLHSTQHKIDELDGFFKTLSLLGNKTFMAVESLEEAKLSEGLMTRREEYGKKNYPSQDLVVDGLEWLATGLSIWRSFKNVRSK